MSRFSITTPIFYVNARPHIGHAYTVVAADVLARAHRLRGDDVFFLTGTDEHGAKIAEAAEAAGTQPQTFANEISQTFRDAWEALNISHTEFIRTTDPRHKAGVSAALQTLHKKGLLYQKSYRGLYCTGCEKFVTQKDLDTAGKCLDHQRLPVEVEEKNWFFKLSEFLSPVQKAVESGAVRVEPRERANEVRGLFAHGLEDFSISRSRERVPWGIPLPFDSSQTCYVWVDALLNYVTALGYGPDANFPIPNSRFQRYWPADVHIIGQDILKFHAVYWPAILLALDLPLPRSLAVHGFFTVNGQKISKSLGNTIDPIQLVQRYGSDAARYLLVSQFPFGTSGDVQAARFDEQYNAVLANTIGNLVSRTSTLLQKFSDSRIPDAPPDNSAITPAPRSPEGAKWGAPSEAISVAADLDNLLNAPIRLAQELNQYADRSAPWKETDPAKRATAIHTLADGVVSLALLVEPLLPRASAAIQSAFGAADRQLAAAGTPVQPTDPPVLFPRARELSTSTPSE